MDKIDFVNSTHPAVNDENLNRMQDNIERAINAQVSGDTLPIGALMPFSSDTIPTNWLLCDGRAIDRTEYNQLFAVIGTKYGNGDGSTTFNLPDMRGRVAVGQDTRDEELDRLGKKGGEKAHTLTIDEMPSHSHTAINYANGYTGGSQDRFFTLIAGVETGGTPKAVKETGSSQPHNIMQPYSVQNYIIKAFQSVGLIGDIVDYYNNNYNLNQTYTCNTVNKLLDKYPEETITIGTLNGKPIKRGYVSMLIPSISPDDVPMEIQLYGNIETLLDYNVLLGLTDQNLIIKNSAVSSQGNSVYNAISVWGYKPREKTLNIYTTVRLTNVTIRVTYEYIEGD